LLATNLPLLPRSLQLPVTLGMDLQGWGIFTWKYADFCTGRDKFHMRAIDA
jgi:hypothetical protein